MPREFVKLLLKEGKVEKGSDYDEFQFDALRQWAALTPAVRQAWQPAPALSEEQKKAAQPITRVQW